MVPRHIRPPQPQAGRHIRGDQRGGSTTQNEHVRVSFQHFGDCLDSCPLAAISAWLTKLKRLTASTWRDVTNSPREGLGHEKIDREQLKFPIPPQLTEDVVFLAFRCGGAARMIGYRDAAVLHVLWFAHDHSAY
jgi:hypothetical protein